MRHYHLVTELSLQRYKSWPETWCMHHLLHPLCLYIFCVTLLYSNNGKNAQNNKSLKEVRYVDAKLTHGKELMDQITTET